MEINHYHFESLPSTNDWAKKNLNSFERDKLSIVMTDSQTAGRGQYGRKWVSPSNQNIAASFCFFIEEDQQDPLSLTHVLAISTARILEEYGVPSQIKWPNDVLVNQKKIAGILCETEYFPPQYGVIIGIGLNVNMPQETLETVGQPATSLAVETGKEWDINEVLEKLRDHFMINLAQFFERGFEPFLPQFRKLILPGLRNHRVL